MSATYQTAERYEQMFGNVLPFGHFVFVEGAHPVCAPVHTRSTRLTYQALTGPRKKREGPTVRSFNSCLSTNSG